MQNVLKNKYVLYAVSALAVLNVLGYLSIGSMECLGVFALTALVCQQYNKNMTVCLLAAIFAANVVFGCGRIKENFTEGAEVKKDGAMAEIIKDKATKGNGDAQNIVASAEICCANGIAKQDAPEVCASFECQAADTDTANN